MTVKAHNNNLGSKSCVQAAANYSGRSAFGWSGSHAPASRGPGRGDTGGRRSFQNGEARLVRVGAGAERQAPTTRCSLAVAFPAKAVSATSPAASRWQQDSPCCRQPAGDVRAPAGNGSGSYEGTVQTRSPDGHLCGPGAPGSAGP